jgi:hypothetical protein
MQVLAPERVMDGAMVGLLADDNRSYNPFRIIW